MNTRSSRKRYLALAAVILAVAIVAIIKAYAVGNADVVGDAAMIPAQASQVSR